VIYSQPSDLDRKVENEERVELTGRGRRRGPAVLDLHGEALPAVPGGDGVLDVLRKVAARSRAWMKISKASCERAERRLEVSSTSAWRRARRRSACT
jgi:hypothetical protein